MSIRSGLLLVITQVALILASPGAAPGQLFSKDQSPEEKPRRDRLKTAVGVGGMAVGAGGVALGVLTFNPGVMLISSSLLGAGTGQVLRNKLQARAVEGATPTTGQAAPAPGTMVPVPDRPGYYYDPANPSQLYVDPAAIPNSMQARIAEPARINVRIANTAKDGRTIHYTVSGTPYSVPPGYTQVLATPEGSVIAYDRGDPAGTERFLLAKGSYEFRVVDQGWRFYATDRPASALAKAGDADGRPSPAPKPAPPR